MEGEVMSFFNGSGVTKNSVSVINLQLRKIIACLLLCGGMVGTFAVYGEGFDCDVDYGRTAFSAHQCAGCHTFIVGDMDKSGPNLNGLFGRNAASIEFPHGFSEALKRSEIVWNEQVLDAFLTNPARLVPGTKMTFLGMDDSQDRADLICFLQEATRED